MPPFRRTLTFSGHSFSHMPGDAASRLRPSCRRLQFPSCAAGDASFVTIALHNSAHTPVSYQLVVGTHPECFAFEPQQAVVAAGETFVVAAKFSAQQAGTMHGMAQLAVNDARDQAQEITLIGVASTTAITVDTGQHVLCAPTCIGASSQRTVHLRNNSRLPVHCECKIEGAELPQVFSMQPSKLSLAGYEEAAVTCTFAPVAAGAHTASACWHAQPDTTVASGAALSTMRSDLHVQLQGEALQAALSMQPEAVDFGAVRIGDTVTAPVNLFNHSAGALSYALESGEFSRRQPVPSTAAAHVPRPLLTADQPTGVIAARSFVTVNLALELAQRGDISIELTCCSLLPSVAGAGADSTAHVHAQAAISASACYPELQIHDVFAADLPKLSSWHMASVPAINEALAGPISAHEQWLTKQEQHSGMPVEVVLGHLHPVPVALGCVVLGAQRTVSIHLVNTGRCASLCMESHVYVFPVS